MTRAGALPHRVDLIPRDLTARDDRNNEVPVDAGDITDIPARVDILTDTEDLDDRDRKVRRIAVIIPYQWGGQVLELDSVDAIRWEGNRYELTGEAARADDHAGRQDHYELEAERITG